MESSNEIQGVFQGSTEWIIIVLLKDIRMLINYLLTFCLTLKICILLVLRRGKRVGKEAGERMILVVGLGRGTRLRIKRSNVIVR
jgi:hypothetical protein